VSIRREKDVMIYHMVLRAYRPGTLPEEIQEVDDLTRRCAEIDGVQKAVAGPRLDPAPFAEDLTHAALLTVRDASALKEFLQNPFHQELAALSRRVASRMLVIDVEGQ
jgi:hypothetical protein